jgi:hypothetical protein
LRAVLDSVFANPVYRWVDRPDPAARIRGWLAELEQWLATLREHNPLGFKAFIAALIVVLVVILVHAAWVLLRTVRPRTPDPGFVEAPAGRRDRDWYRREAERLAGEGRYAEAMQADFLALMLALDAAQRVRFHPAKTPLEYTREPGLDPRIRAELQELVSALYRYLFARHPCGFPEYSEWRNRVPKEHAPAH